MGIALYILVGVGSKHLHSFTPWLKSLFSPWHMYLYLQTLPALKSFCVYAALGILSLFIIQSTFFVAWLTIDQRRQDASRDACCIWIKYVSFEPNRCSQRLFLPWFLRKFFASLLLSLPIKLRITLLLSGFWCALTALGEGVCGFTGVDLWRAKA